MEGWAAVVGKGKGGRFALLYFDLSYIWGFLKSPDREIASGNVRPRESPLPQLSELFRQRDGDLSTRDDQSVKLCSQPAKRKMLVTGHLSQNCKHAVDCHFDLLLAVSKQ